MPGQGDGEGRSPVPSNPVTSESDRSPGAPRLEIWLGYALVAGMSTCLVVTLVQVMELFLPAWQGDYLVFFGFLAAWEAIFSQRRFNRRRELQQHWLVYRLAEWVILLLALKLVTYLVYGWSRLVLDLVAWQRNFLAEFFNPEFLFDSLVVLAVWGQSTWFAQALDELEVRPEELQEDIESGIWQSRSEARERLVSQILAVGVGMTLVTALLRVEAVTSWLELSQLRGGVYNLVLFFVQALLLLSLVQYANLRVRWIFAGLPVRPGLAGRWFAYSLGFALALVLLTAWLPTGYSIGLLATLNHLIEASVLIFTTVMMILLAPVLWLVNWLGSLFGNQAASPPLEMPQVEPSVLTPPASIPWLEWLKSVLFWVIFLGVIGFSLAAYFSEHRQAWQAMQQWPILQFLRNSWEWLRRRWQAARHTAAGLGREAVQRLRRLWSRPATAQPWGFLRLRGLTPRQQVLFYFLALVRRGEEAGMSRQPAETASEYAGRLSTLLEPESREQAELQDLAVGFVEARYTAHPVSDSLADRVRHAWQHLQQRLRGMRIDGGK